MAAAPPRPLVILAGAGLLPLAVAAHCRGEGRTHRLVAFRGQADRATRTRADAVVDLLDVRRVLSLLDGWAPAGVMLAGSVARPGLSALVGGLAALRNHREIAELFARGDDGLLRAVIALIEEHGHPVVGAHDIAPQLLSRPGVYGAVRPDAEDEKSIALGFACLADLSPYDMGQAAIVAGRRVLAVEGLEGTDRMIARVRRSGRGWLTRPKALPAILVKTAKTTQDLRVDLPAIGPRTVVRMADAGFRGVAVGAGVTLVLDPERTVEAADRAGLFLIGVQRHPPQSLTR